MTVARVDTRDAQLAAFHGLEPAVHDLRCLATLLARSENDNCRCEDLPDGQRAVYFDSPLDAEIHGYLVRSVERQVQQLTKAYLACWELGRAQR